MKTFLSDRSSVILRKVGLTLFIAAFVVPAGHAAFVPSERDHVHDYLLPFWGVRVFISTPQMAFALPLWRGPPIDGGFTSYEITIRVILLAAWFGNFLTLFRLPRAAAFGAICLPWLVYVFWFDLVTAFVPFYFWAVGITLIHLPRALENPEPNQTLEPTAAAGRGSS